ncbi:DMT family transporter [Serratia entomophila]|uniref:DMT family transporter n=1 Tax=Serratia entomophila TaxID=42906 RepID=UPI0021784125|nr:DMT family transporter [Serratia entomophila]CAI1013778.1 carboxylate/amino acid/amine transporter [Serratia entomophila]CAI1664526.1 carboxylate/amino acid/amine transporter [Serratia entomophila]CAI1719811.1 carboxylate/amino acid/amine transporter [Serratia entomophila]CAI1804669.1 carboxylate/amino acid/amine transporter [Serratia entomophila]CAI1866550.1 carboxylate/amino acid/amine transporter [Serratia entomophila]
MTITHKGSFYRRKSVIAPFFLILIWSTGFIAARAVAEHADPNLFLTFRFLAAAAVFALLAANCVWPKGRQFIMHLLTGMLMNGVYLAASWWAVANGLAAGVMSLIGGLQPLFTALIFALVLRKPIGLRSWAGLAIGFIGVALVLSPRLTGIDIGNMALLPILLGFGSIVALTIGIMVQKSSLAAADLRAAGAIQHLGAALVTGALAALMGSGQWDNSPTLWFSLLWSAGVLSLGGTALFIWMVRHGDLTRITALMLLVPPAAALQAYFLFSEALSPMQLGGFVLTLLGVAIVQKISLRRRSRLQA